MTDALPRRNIVSQIIAGDHWACHASSQPKMTAVVLIGVAPSRSVSYHGPFMADGALRMDDRVIP